MSYLISFLSVSTQTDDSMFLCSNRVDNSTHQSRSLVESLSQLDDRLMIKLLVNDCKMHQQKAQIMKAKLNRYIISQEKMQEQLLSLRQTVWRQRQTGILAITKMIEEECLSLMSCSQLEIYGHTIRPKRMRPLSQFPAIEDLLYACHRLSAIREELFDSTLKEENDFYHYHEYLS